MAVRLALWAVTAALGLPIGCSDQDAPAGPPAPSTPAGASRVVANESGPGPDTAIDAEKRRPVNPDPTDKPLPRGDDVEKPPRPHAIVDEEFEYSDLAREALDELEKRGGKWEVPEGYLISVTKKYADVYGTPPAVSNLEASGDVVVNVVGMRLRRIQPGVFTMGSPDDERKRRANEVRRKVRITRPFWIGATEVTNRQYMAVMGRTEAFAKLHRELLDSPVNGPSWREANAFCEKLSAIDGRPYRLPTEAEWEFACRAGTDEPLSFGGSAACLARRPTDGCRAKEYVWWSGDNPATKPKPVSLKSPNAWGLWDMHGNVAEFCLDRLPDTVPDGELVDPVGDLDALQKPARGGRFRDSLPECRAAYRSLRFSADLGRLLGVGFRVVQAPMPD